MMKLPVGCGVQISGIDNRDGGDGELFVMPTISNKSEQ
jgi:hypothetical protein